MPEFFDVSLIFKKENDCIANAKHFLNKKFGLIEGQNRQGYFETEVFVSFLDDCETDFIEVSFSFSNQVFHEEKFSDELKTFSDFINVCFGYTGDVAFVLCSYEMNGYLLGNLKSMLDINDDILARFPIHYVRQRNNERSLPIVNFAAQDIFTENPLK